MYHDKIVREFERMVAALIAEPMPNLPPTEPSIPKA
jgi:hypothetical protein